jgi:hypothetical protein
MSPLSADFETREIILPISEKIAVITEGDGKSDRQLFRGSKPRFKVMYEYLAALTVSIGDITYVDEKQIKNLLVPDQEFLAVEIFRLNYDDVFEFTFTCPACATQSDQAADLRKLEMRDVSKESSGAPDPIICVTLPRSGKVAEIGMLDGHKESVILGQLNAGELDVNQSDFLCLRKLDGSSDFSYEDVVVLKKKDHQVIRSTRQKLVAGYDTHVVIPCPSCGVRARINLLTHPDFLYPGV